MGFVGWYVIVLFLTQFICGVYYLGAGKNPEPSDSSVMGRVIASWIVLLPMVGRVFGWW